MTSVSKVLVADDDPVTRMMLGMPLGQQGHDVLEASTAESCLSIALHTSLRVILLDATLADLDGFKCCAALHDRLKDQCPPVLMVIKSHDETLANRVFEAQAIDYVTKPINATVLQHRVCRILREQQLINDLETARTQLAATARTDSLTQLANRRQFEQTLETEWRRLARDRRSLGLVLCNLDHFKQYNEAHGHSAGDRCLQKVAVTLRTSVFRTPDLVARYDGEEFVVLLPDADEAGIEVVAERIRYQLDLYQIPHRNSPVSNIVTCSMGGAVATPNLEIDPRTLIDIADKALYEAKARGRNRFILWRSDL